MNFFKNDSLHEHWEKRLAYFKEIDITLSPIFEAVYYYGKWKYEKEFQFALSSFSKFQEMEELSYKKNWIWVLSFCITEQIDLAFKLSRRARALVGSVVTMFYYVCGELVWGRNQVLL